MSDNPTIYVDLIEEQPWSLAQFDEHVNAEVWPNADTERKDAIQLAYRAYLADFQPYRILVLSGDNHEPLFRSTERYFNEADARHAVEIAFGNRSNVYLRQAETGNVALRLATE